jgi:hypothetical protein
VYRYEAPVLTGAVLSAVVLFPVRSTPCRRCHLWVPTARLSFPSSPCRSPSQRRSPAASTLPSHHHLTFSLPRTQDVDAGAPDAASPPLAVYLTTFFSTVQCHRWAAAASPLRERPGHPSGQRGYHGPPCKLPAPEAMGCAWVAVSHAAAQAGRTVPL